ncbi:MAG: ABC transporter permease [Acidimicrobiales bacterium]
MTATLMPDARRSDRAVTVDLHKTSTAPVDLLRQLWRARELLVILSRKEFHTRYRRASFGALWAVGIPLLQAIVIAVVFSKVVRFHNAPHYALFVISGMVAWVYFSTVTAMGATAIVDNAELHSKVYFPRIVLPLVQCGAALYGLVISVAIVLALCPLMGVGLRPRALLLLPAMVLLVALCAGIVLVASALHVYFRDVKYLVTAALLVWMYVTPLIYPPLDAPHALRVAIEINPTTGVLDLFHFATIGTPGALLVPVGVTLAWTAGLVVLGIALQARYDRTFTDLL